MLLFTFYYFFFWFQIAFQNSYLSFSNVFFSSTSFAIFTRAHSDCTLDALYVSIILLVLDSPSIAQWLDLNLSAFNISQTTFQSRCIFNSPSFSFLIFRTTFCTKSKTIKYSAVTAALRFYLLDHTLFSSEIVSKKSYIS